MKYDSGFVPLQTDGAYSSIFGEVYKSVTRQVLTEAIKVETGKDAIIKIDGKLELSEDDKVNRRGGNVYINKVYGMTEINGIRYKIRSATYNDETETSEVTLYDYTKSPDEGNIFILPPLDTSEFSLYDIETTTAISTITSLGWTDWITWKDKPWPFALTETV
jgi:hypothetical protein